MALNNQPDAEVTPSPDAIRAILGTDTIDLGAHMAALAEGMNDMPTPAEDALDAQIRADRHALYATLEDGPELPLKNLDDSMEQAG